MKYTLPEPDGRMSHGEFIGSTFIRPKAWNEKQMQAAYEAGLAASQWQPIETAPTHTRILVGGTEIGTCVASAEFDGHTPTGLWGVVNDVYVKATHWMPLPAAPEPKK